MRIESQDAFAFHRIGGRADAGVVILCDHARNVLPPEYGSLGLAASEFQRHIAYDIGAEAIATEVARQLDVPAVFSHFSRLLIDINRGLDDPTLVMRLSDGAIVPGNREADEREVAARVARFWQPYHSAVAETISACTQTGVTPVILSLHSMTDCWKGVKRPWETSILWADDDRLARPLLDGFAAIPGLIVGDNEPYHGRLEGDTLWQHAHGSGLAGAIIEYRQDLVGDVRGQKLWADRTVALMRAILQRRCPVLHQVRRQELRV
ncbi:MAG: N-formylglutamate amidohydrolase [Hyphomicrobiaceae bacterium]